MASDLIDPAVIADALRKNVEGWTPSVERRRSAGSSRPATASPASRACRARWRTSCSSSPAACSASAFNLDEAEIGCIIFGDAAHIEEGDPVKQTGRILSVPVGDGFLGRVVDALGRPIDGKGPIPPRTTRRSSSRRPTSCRAKAVKEPLYTGITAIDAMTAIGRGQRQLIIGDRQTGKTAVAIDTIINQKQYWGTGQAVRCIYVAVGQKASTVAEVVETLRENGALEYTVVVNAAASTRRRSSTSLPTPARRSGAHWMDDGKHVADRLRRPVQAGRRRTARSRCCSAARPAARPTPATSSTCTPACSSARRSSPRARRRVA